MLTVTAVVEDAVEDRGSDDAIAKHVVPGLVAGQDERPF